MVLNLNPETEAKLRERAKCEGRDPDEFANWMISAWLDGKLTYLDDSLHTADDAYAEPSTSVEENDGNTMSEVTLSAIASPFAEAIFTKIKFLLEHKEQLLPYQRSRFNESIMWDIKLFSTFVAPQVSVAAMKEAGEDVDLYSERWHNQHRFDLGRKKFHWEHFVPVSQIREKCREAKNVSDVVSILGLVSVVWILKAEDEILTNLGYKSERPDPAEAYHSAGITIHNAATKPS